jgi:hypothetical protein
MANYINSEKHRLVFFDNGKLVSLSPGEAYETKSLIPQLANYLEEPAPKPKKVDIVEEIEADQTSDLPDDFYVVIDDEIVEELRKEQPKPRKRRSKRQP